MPPQTPPQTPGQSPNPDESKPYAPVPGSKFDFILNAGQKPKRKLLNAIAQLPRSMLILVSVIFLLFGLITVSSILSNRNNVGTKQLLELTARQQEIVRVSNLAADLLEQKGTQNLEATTEATIASDQSQLLSYLKINRIKVNSKNLSAYKNKGTDAQLAAGRQSNSADQAYTAYLKTQLNNYRTSLQTAYAKAGPKARLIISDAFDSAGIILKDL